MLQVCVFRRCKNRNTLLARGTGNGKMHRHIDRNGSEGGKDAHGYAAVDPLQCSPSSNDKGMNTRNEAKKETTPAFGARVGDEELVLVQEPKYVRVLFPAPFEVEGPSHQSKWTTKHDSMGRASVTASSSPSPAYVTTLASICGRHMSVSSPRFTDRAQHKSKQQSLDISLQSNKHHGNDSVSRPSQAGKADTRRNGNETKTLSPHHDSSTVSTTYTNSTGLSPPAMPKRTVSMPVEGSPLQSAFSSSPSPSSSSSSSVSTSPASSSRTISNASENTASARAYKRYPAHHVGEFSALSSSYTPFLHLVLKVRAPGARKDANGQCAVTLTRDQFQSQSTVDFQKILTRNGIPLIDAASKEPLRVWFQLRLKIC